MQKVVPAKMRRSLESASPSRHSWFITLPVSRKITSRIETMEEYHAGALIGTGRTTLATIWTTPARPTAKRDEFFNASLSSAMT
jgi:hypothetical protein